MITVTIFHTGDCQNCENIISSLEELQSTIPHKIVKVNVEGDDALRNAYPDAPVVQIGPYRLSFPITRQELFVALSANRDRVDQLEKVGDKEFKSRQKRATNFSGSDRFGLWLSTNYMLLFSIVVFLYVGLPFLAPILMKARLTLPANVIYTIYSPLCHQLAFRSFFLFGEQPYYPRSLAGITGVKTYEQVTGQTNIDLIAARNFIGNDIMGYKVALCERDVAIYGAILLFGFIFILTKYRIKPFPWYLWIVFGLIPIGVDGGSQLPGLIQAGLPSWVLIRESTPFLRVLTGGLFGTTTAWYLYPLIQETMAETRRSLLSKQAAISQNLPERNS
jgi:uncharacterized membrane protein